MATLSCHPLIMSSPLRREVVKSEVGEVRAEILSNPELGRVRGQLCLALSCVCGVEHGVSWSLQSAVCRLAGLGCSADRAG